MITGFFTQTILIQARTSSKDAMGQRIPIYTTRSTITGLINVLSARDQYVSSQRSITADFAMYCPSSTVINVNDRVVCDSVNYDVVYVYNPLAKGISLFLKVYLKSVS